MKPRKLILTIKMLTGIPAKEFSRFNTQGIFNSFFADKLKVEEVHVQTVKREDIK